MQTILVLFGGCSSEYEVSLQSAHAVLTHMDPARFRPLPVGITRRGRWLRYTGGPEHIADNTWHTRPADCTPCTLSLDRGRPALLLTDRSGGRVPFDAAFPVLHGKNGEDGTLQGALELAGVPIVGCGTLSGALCMDKDRAHKLAALAGVKVPRGVLCRREDTLPAMARAAEEVGYPLFVKPVRAGSSFGVARVEAPEALPAAAAEAFLHDGEILLEEAVPGFEVGCAVLGNGELTVGVPDEIELAEGFFSYEEKYTLQTSRIHCPARVSPEQAARIQETARRIYRALDCRGFARVDLFLTPAGELVFNEVNTIPGLTAHSRYPAMMAAAGIPFPDLITRLIGLALAAAP